MICLINEIHISFHCFGYILYIISLLFSDKSQTERSSNFLSVTNEIVLYIQNILAERDLTNSEFEITHIPNSCPIK